MPEPTAVLDAIATVVAAVSGIENVNRSRRKPEPGRGKTQAAVLWAGDDPTIAGMSDTNGRTNHNLPVKIRVMTTKDDSDLAAAAYAIFDALVGTKPGGIYQLQPGPIDEPDVLDENGPFIFTDITFIARLRRT